jgi:hypothetical protein
MSTPGEMWLRSIAPFYPHDRTTAAQQRTTDLSLERGCSCLPEHQPWRGADAVSGAIGGLAIAAAAL